MFVSIDLNTVEIKPQYGKIFDKFTPQVLTKWEWKTVCRIDFESFLAGRGLRNTLPRSYF